MNLVSPKWWISMFVSTFVCMIFIVLIKRGLNKVNVPIISEMAQEV